MRRDYFYIGIAIFMVIVVTVFITLSIFGQQKRNSAVKELQSKVAEIKNRSDSQHNSNRKNSVLSTEEGEAAQNSEDEKNITAHEQLAEKMNTLKASEEWELFIECLVRIDDGKIQRKITSGLRNYLMKTGNYLKISVKLLGQISSYLMNHCHYLFIMYVYLQRI